MGKKYNNKSKKKKKLNNKTKKKYFYGGTGDDVGNGTGTDTDTNTDTNTNKDIYVIIAQKGVPAEYTIISDTKLENIKNKINNNKDFSTINIPPTISNKLTGKYNIGIKSRLGKIQRGIRRNLVPTLAMGKTKGDKIIDRNEIIDQEKEAAEEKLKKSRILKLNI